MFVRLQQEISFKSCFQNILMVFILRWVDYACALCNVQWFKLYRSSNCYSGSFMVADLSLVWYTFCSSTTMSFLHGQMVGMFSARSTSSLILSSSSPTGAPFSRNTSNDCSASWTVLFIKSWTESLQFQLKPLPGTKIIS
jgi:hypothetical protein